MENDELINKVGKRLGKTDDLPDELKKQLKSTKMDDLEKQIVQVIEGYDKIANLDEILVGLYRKFGNIHERAFISNKMYRMAANGIIKSVKGKKAVYQME